MKNEQRRENILLKLQAETAPISATTLAKMFSVTRQIIVADIALLRATGHPIRAEHKGYVLEKELTDGLVKRIVVKHGKNEVKDELYIIVDNGGKVIDVIVDHAIYGSISAKLNLSSRYDVDTFVSSIDIPDALPLSVLTEGLHIHTVSVKDNESFKRIVEGLKKINILIEHD